MIFLWNERINHASFVDYSIMPLYARLVLWAACIKMLRFSLQICLFEQGVFAGEANDNI
jgi:hypothetical protein